MFAAIKRFMPKKDMTKTDIVFATVALGSIVIFGIGNGLVGKQLVELKQMRADFEDQRVDMCFEFKAHAIVYHFDSSSMRDYCMDIIGYMPNITKLPVPKN